MRTKRQKLTDTYTAYQAAKTGTRPRRQPKAGIQTRPVVDVPTNRSEAKVLAECLKWLKGHRVFCNRHDCGAGDLGYGFATYGIKYAGDIIGLLPSGIHFEVECKHGRGGTLSPGQQQRMADVRAMGGLYFVVHGVAELMYYFKELI